MFRVQLIAMRRLASNTAAFGWHLFSGRQAEHETVRFTGRTFAVVFSQEKAVFFRYGGVNGF